MRIQEYYQKYPQDIRNNTVLTKKDIWVQLQTDFVVAGKQDFVNISKTKCTLENLVDEIIDNRADESDSRKRIVKEYNLRIQMLKFFPKQYEFWMAKRGTWRINRRYQ